MKTITNIKWSRFNSSTDKQIMPETAKNKILNFMKNGRLFMTGDTALKDPVTGEIFSRTAAHFKDIDDEYSWTSAEVYIFEKYDMKLCPGFINKVLTNG